MIVIAVEMHIDPEQLDAFRERVLRHARNSLSEPGCVRFDVAEDDDHPGHFRIWENYVDMDAVEHHRARDYLLDFRAFCEPIALKREVSLLEMITPE